MGPNTKERLKHQCLPPVQPYYPWLLYFNDYKKNNQTFCNISDPTKTYTRSIPELGASKLLTVQHGWCVLANKGETATNLFLWNPCNLQKIKLPPLKHKGMIIKDWIFSCSPTATDQVCSIFLFPDRYSPNYSNILFYYTLRDKNWTEFDYSEDLVRACALEGRELPNYFNLSNPVYCNGHLYAVLTTTRLLVVIEKFSHGLQIKSAHIFLPSLSPIVSPQRYWLLESNNELFHIEIALDRDQILSVAVERLDFPQKVWKRVKSIKDKVVFLSELDLPFVCRAINPETEGGRIYLTLNRNKYVHKIEDNSVVICQAFSGLPRRRHRSMWFMLNQRMTISPQEERGKTQIRGEKRSVVIHSNETRDMTTNSCVFPFELFEAVAEYLNALDFLQFRAASSLFRKSAPLPLCRSFSHISMSNFDDISPSPLFVFFEQENALTFVHPKHGIKYKYSINLPEVIQGDCEFCYSKDGWLLMARNKFFNLFFNPFTKEVKQLADGPEECRNIPCVGFSHPPTSPECVIVELHDTSDDMTVYMTRLGKKEWEEFAFEDCDFYFASVSPCFHNGAFYYLNNKGKLGIFKVVGEEDILWEESEKPHTPCEISLYKIDPGGYYKCFLVECNGSLLSVFEGAFGNWVRVFKLDESKMTWLQVESLENHMIFVGNQSFSSVANIPEMANKIYFPRFYDENIVFYSLATKKYHTFKSSEVVDFHCMVEPFNTTWIEPRWCKLS